MGSERADPPNTGRETHRRANHPDQHGIDVVLEFAVTKASEQIVDLTAPYTISGLTIAARREPSDTLHALASSMDGTRTPRRASRLIVGTIAWRIERHHDRETYGGGRRHIGAGALDVEALRHDKTLPAAGPRSRSGAAVCGRGPPGASLSPHRSPANDLEGRRAAPSRATISRPSLSPTPPPPPRAPPPATKYPNTHPTPPTPHPLPPPTSIPHRRPSPP